MIRCSKCGRDVEAGQNFCPYCAQPLAVSGTEGEPPRAETGAEALQPSTQGRERFLQHTDLEPPQAVPFSSLERDDEMKGTRRTLFLVVGVASLLLVAGLVYYAMRERAPRTEPRLENAVRAGSPEFDEARPRITVDFDPNEDATESPRALGDIVMTATPTVRNFTNRTINGLELHAAVVDLEGKPIKERTVVRTDELAPNKTLRVPISLEGFKQTDVRANVKVELTGVRFK